MGCVNIVLHLRIAAPQWDGGGNPRKAAKCLKFPGDNERDDPWFDDMEESKQLCNGQIDGVICPLRQKCLMFAAVNNEHYGIWGGLYPEQRHWMRRNVPRAEWSFYNAPPQELVLAEIEARQACRKASGLSGDQQEALAAA
jgi:hypothetical protein